MDIKKILNNKKVLIAGGAVIALIIIIIVASIISNPSSKEKEEKEVESLNDKLNKLAVEFYETKYYSSIDDKQKLSNFKDTGVNINLTNIEVLLPLNNETKDLLKKRECDFDKTRVMIYPKSPYGLKDYEIKVELSCKK